MLIEGLYTIQSLEQNDQEVIASVKLNATHDVFKGHFPDSPVMPGVCMIQMIKELIEQALDKKLFLNVVSNVKFMAIINPVVNETIDLKMNISEMEGIVKVKNVTSYEDTVALKLSATFKIME